MPNLEPIPMIAMAPQLHSASQGEFGGASASASASACASDDWGYEAALPYLTVGGFETPPASQERI